MILHTLQAFRATQKGQVSVNANTEVILLSDTHWYWWYVRVPKTNSEGFVPAELLELPNERQARINSRINVRLSVAPQPTVRFKANSKAKKRVHFNVELQFSPSELNTDDIFDKLPKLSSHTTSAVDNTSVSSALDHSNLDESLINDGNRIKVQPIVA